MYKGRFNAKIPNMRIIAGTYKHRLLEYPKNQKKVRPTRDMVKEALFSILGDRVVDCRFLDLYAGVGSIGLEALSRGAQEVVMIDLNPRHIFINAEKLGCLDKVEIYRNEAVKAIKILGNKKRQFELIYLDPPYDTEEIADSLKKLAHFDILANGGWIVAETAADKEIDVSGYEIVSERLYGQTKLIFLKGA
jgi:16S rRNA (guanine(966)-N(2))-methyltransferase RsmD